MLRSNSSERDGLKLGSSCEVSPAFAELMPVKFGWGNVCATVGSGAVVPSVPIRKAFVGSTFPAPRHCPAMLAPGHVMGCSGPEPSSGTKTKSTPFNRPKMRLHPPRITVWPCPNILPRTPLVKRGFHAAATWGLNPP